MIWLNRNTRQFIIAGIVIIVVIFVTPFIWPVDRDWYFRNLSWMVPLAVVVLIAPIVPFMLSNWDIHFSFQSSEDNLIANILNHGNTTFGFNRIQFASGKKYRIFGKRKFYPESGIYDSNVEFHGSDTPSSVLHGHIGCTLRKGLPITLTIRNHQAAENLRDFDVKKVHLSLYYEGTKQRVCSQPIPPEMVTRIIKNYQFILQRTFGQR